MLKKAMVSVAVLVLVLFFGLINCSSYAEEKGLVGYWKFDEIKGKIAKDFSGNGNDGTIYGAVAKAGKTGQALSFDGANAYVDCGNKDSLNPTDAITVEVWVKIDEQNASERIIVGKGWFSDPAGASWWLLKDTNKTLKFGAVTVRQNAVYNAEIDTFGKTWYHIVGTYDGSYSRIYVNGVEGRGHVQAGSLPITGTSVKIGVGYYKGKSFFFSGLIDEVRIYNRALTEIEVKNHYKTERQAFEDSIVSSDNTLNADKQIFTGKGLKVGVIQGGHGSTSILEALRGAEGIDAQPLTSSPSKAMINQCQVLVLPLLPRADKKEGVPFRIDRSVIRDISKFVRGGGGLIMTASLNIMGLNYYRDVCTFKLHSDGRAFVPWQVIRKHPVTAGIKLQEEYYVSPYCVEYNVGKNGIVLAESIENGNPVVVVGPHGKGRFVSCGMLIGMSEKFSGDTKLTSEQRKLIINAVKWCGEKE